MGSHEKKRKKKRLKKKAAEITVLGEKVTVKPPAETLLEGLNTKKKQP